jgi:hypothetical protein
MIRDIYIRDPEDPNFQYGVLEHRDAIESIISKIKVIMSTHPGEVLGDIAFGVGIDDLVFESRINKNQLEEKIKDQINRYINETKDYDIRPVVSFGKAENYDYAIIDFFINDQRAIGLLIK